MNSNKEEPKKAQSCYLNSVWLITFPLAFCCMSQYAAVSLGNKNKAILRGSDVISTTTISSVNSIVPAAVDATAIREVVPIVVVGSTAVTSSSQYTNLCLITELTSFLRSSTVVLMVFFLLLSTTTAVTSFMPLPPMVCGGGTMMTISLSTAFFVAKRKSTRRNVAGYSHFCVDSTRPTCSTGGGIRSRNAVVSVFLGGMQQNSYSRNNGNNYFHYYSWSSPSMSSWKSRKERLFPPSSFLEKESSSSALVSSASPIKEDITINDNGNSYDDDEISLYRELQYLSNQIRQYDALYYGDDNTFLGSNNNNNNDQQGSTTSKTNPPMLPEDDVYDALCQREEWICRTYPHLLIQWQKESKLGIHATRYGGRIGAGTKVTDSSSSSTTNNMIRKDELIPPVAEDSSTINNISANTSNMNLSIRPKQQHLQPMLSLDNVHNTGQLLSWLERVRKRIVSSTTTTTTTMSSTDNSFGSNNDNKDTTMTSVLSTSTASIDMTTSRTTTPNTIRILTEPKLDGLSLSLRYQRQSNSILTNANNSSSNGLKNDDNIATSLFVLQWACTRGDGLQGQDVTGAIRRGLSLPEYLFVSNNIMCPQSQHQDFVKASTTAFDSIQDFEIRGEIILPLSVFQEHQQVNEEVNSERIDPITNPPNKRVFSNARNAAAGILLRKDIGIVAIADRNKTGSTRDATNQTKLSDPSNMDKVNLDEDKWLSQLCFYAYDIVATTDWTLDACETRNLLSSWGFQIPEPVLLTTVQVNSETIWNESHIVNILQYHESLQNHRQDAIPVDDSNHTPDNRNQNKTKGEEGDKWGDYQMDGCVHKVVEPVLRVLLGTSNRAPRWAVAHKFTPTTIVTELLGIEVQVGRTGVLTPVALLSPVELGGVTVQRATLHNFVHMRQILGGTESVPRGFQVLVRRAGDVIPQVIGIVDGNKLQSDDNDMIDLSVPAKCTACGSDTFFETVANKSSSSSNSSSDKTFGPVLRCGGPPLLCSPRSVGALQHAYSRDALDIAGLSEARIQQLMDNGFLRRPSDLFVLANDSTSVDRLAALDKWGPKSSQNLAATAKLVAVDGVSLARFIYSLGIRHVGVHTSRQIARIYGTAEAFLRDLEAAKSPESARTSSDSSEAFALLRDENEETKGIGPALASSLIAFSRENELVEAAWELSRMIRIADDTNSISSVVGDPQGSEGPLKGLTVVFTGSIPQWSRNKAQEAAKRMGAKSTPGKVSKAAGLVVVGKSGGRKAQDALDLGVRTMGYERFIEMVRAFESEALATETETSESTSSTENSNIWREENEENKRIGPVLASPLIEATKQLDEITINSALTDDPARSKVPLKGIAVVFTGTIPNWPRIRAQEAAKRMGAKSTPLAVSMKNCLLVVGESPGTKKIEEANCLGVRTIDYVQFIEMIETFDKDRKL